ncbi:MAG: hypothetical protein L6Q78_02935 [Bacteroidia bacterium]|nr:hypothetical protein [Bacteroidia bacterium]
MVKGSQFTLDTLKKQVLNWLAFVSKAKLWIVFVAITGLIGGFLFAYLSKPYYESRLTFIINESKPNVSSGLGAIVGQLGLGSFVNPTITDERIIFLAGTKRIQGQALLKKMESGESIANSLLKFYKLDAAFKNDTAMNGFTEFHSTDIRKLDYQEAIAMKSLLEILTRANLIKVESVKKKATSFVGNTSTGVMELVFKHKDEKVSRAFVLALYDEISNFYIRAMAKSQQEQFDLISNKVDSVKQLLELLESEKALAIDQGLGLIRTQGRLRESRLRRDVEVLSIMYGELLKNKELTKYNLEQQKPVFELVDLPEFPLDKIEKSKLAFSLAGGIASTFLLILGLTFLFIVRYRFFDSV